MPDFHCVETLLQRLYRQLQVRDAGLQASDPIVHDASP